MQYNWNNRLILVAEDDPINFKYLELLIQKRTGAKIIWAKDGQEAYEKAINHSSIDIVLLDLLLPEINGLELLSLLKKSIPNLPIIMQTANSWNNEEETSYMLGANGFFNKPLDIDLLFERMNTLMKSYSKLRRQEQNTVNIDHLNDSAEL